MDAYEEVELKLRIDPESAARGEVGFEAFLAHFGDAGSGKRGGGNQQ